MSGMDGHYLPRARLTSLCTTILQLYVLSWSKRVTPLPSLSHPTNCGESWGHWSDYEVPVDAAGNASLPRHHLASCQTADVIGTSSTSISLFGSTFL